MFTLFGVFIQMALLIFLGFVLRKKRVIDDRIQKGLSDILLKAVLPFNILYSSQNQYSDLLIKAMIAVAGASLCYYLFALISMRLVTNKTSMEDQEKRIFVMSAVFANTGFVGFPLMNALFGDSGVLLASVYNMIFNIFMYTYGVHLISNHTNANSSSSKLNNKALFINPITIASVVAIVLFVIPFRLPLQVTDTISTVGDMTGPLSMMIIGSTLATVDFKKLFNDKKSYIVSVIRLLVFPFIMLAAVLCVRHYVYIMPVTGTAIVMMTALPGASMNVIYSEEFNCAPKFAARTFFQTVIFMIITLPLMMYLCMYLFPQV